MNIHLPHSAPLIDLIGSKIFFRFVVGLFIIEAATIALSGNYPMAFDEDFHFGIIKLYAGHINPFWNARPAGADTYGAITRDPSYLYHYLMSFPYRALREVTQSQHAQVLALRAINIGLLACSLPLYRRLLRRTHASPALVNTVILLFVLIPIVPLLGAQINYDNLTLPLTALSLLLTLRFSSSLRHKQIDTGTGLLLLSVCLLSSLVKYAYLPIFIGIVLFLGTRLLQNFPRLRGFTPSSVASWKRITTIHKMLLVLFLVLSSVLFTERYGVNLVRYHTPVPDCAQVLLYDQCQHYGPWIRDYNFAHSKPPATDHNALRYTQHWLYGMWFRSFFAVDGPASLYQTRGPLLLPAVTAIVTAFAGVVAAAVSFRRLFRQYSANALWLLLLTAGIYGAVLWLTEYQLFYETGQPVAINGRYLLPILPGLMVIAGIGLKAVLPNKRASLAFAGIIVFCMACGGGSLTYALRSNDAWYWPHTPLRIVNHGLQRGLGPIVPGYSNPILFLH